MKDVYKLPLPPGGLVSESLLAESGAASEVSNYAEQHLTSPSTRSTIAPQYFSLNLNLIITITIYFHIFSSSEVSNYTDD